MDRLVHTALNSLKNLADQRVASANNLANMNVPGYRRDLPNEGRAFYIESPDMLTTRAMQLEKGPHSFATGSGMISRTGESMDLAIADEGYFYIAPQTGGDTALSRRGDMRIGSDGMLLNGAGDKLLDSSLQPISVPPARAIVVDQTGTIWVEPLGGAPGEQIQVATLASVTVQDQTLEKGIDGHIRTVDGTVPAPNQAAGILQGMLEGANVNVTEELVASIDLQRTFEINLRMITNAKELDEAGSRLMRMPEA